MKTGQFKKSVISALTLGALALGVTSVTSVPAQAQYGDLSPVLIVESGPSDNPEYRRMLFVRFLSGDRVSVNYKAYNRAEFIQTPNTLSLDDIRACSNGSANSLSQIRAFEADEARRERRGEAPKVTKFCIKNVQNWEGGNRQKYLDPIFNGMPLAGLLN